MDTRVIRTRNALQNAMLELAKNTPLDQITIGDIAKQAQVNRSSFYLHYNDKDTLLADALEARLDESATEEKLHTEVDQPRSEVLQDYLTHVFEYSELYRQVLNDSGSGEVVGRLRGHIRDIVERALSKLQVTPYPLLPRDIAAAGVAGLAEGIIAVWLLHDPMPSVETAAEWIWQMVLPETDSDALEPNPAAIQLQQQSARN